MQNLKYEFGDFLSNVHLKDLMLPSQITMILTDECNLDCKFCSVAKTTRNYMDFEFAKKILLYCSKNGIYNICLSGGEPTLYPKINQLIQYACSLKLKLFLTTNGMLLDKIENPCLLDGIGISLHGTEQVHDSITGINNSYKITLQNLLKIKCPRTNINYTFSKLNSSYCELEHVANIASNLGFPMTVARINREGKALNGEYDVKPNVLLEYISELLSKGHRISVSNCIAPCSVKQNFRYLTHGCSAGCSFAGIDPNGNVKICPTASFSIGNLYEKDLLTIWNSDSMKKMRSLDWLPVTCKTCYDILKCRGGCKIENYNKEIWPSFGDILANETFDEIWTILSKALLELTINRVRKEEEYYILLGPHLRTCNDSVISVLKKIDGRNTGDQILKQYEIKQHEQIKMLLVALYRDSFITLV